MCRSSTLKWQYFRDLIILFLEYNRNERTINLRELWRMPEAAIERYSPKIDALPNDFGFWQ